MVKWASHSQLKRHTTIVDLSCEIYEQPGIIHWCPPPPIQNISISLLKPSGSRQPQLTGDSSNGMQLDTSRTFVVAGNNTDKFSILPLGGARPQSRIAREVLTNISILYQEQNIHVSH